MLTLSLNPPGASLGSLYSYTPVASGGTEPYGFSLASGVLPSGLSLDPATGAISGTPTAAGSFAISIQVADAMAATQSASAALVVGAAATYAFGW